jgi:uncharacterized protein YbaA (DUF1428 family)
MRSNHSWTRGRSKRAPTGAIRRWEPAPETLQARSDVMAKYVDGFVTPVPKDKVEVYREFAQLSGKIFRENGALEFVECVADDVKPGKVTSFPQSVDLQPNETVMFSWITYASRSERDRIMEKTMKDPRLANLDPKTMPFDMKRMFFGGFEVLVSL